MCVCVCVCISRDCLLPGPLCDPMDCSPPDSSVHGISQARILEWVAISFSRGSSRPRDRTQTDSSPPEPPGKPKPKKMVEEAHQVSQPHTTHPCFSGGQAESPRGTVPSVRGGGGSGFCRWSTRTSGCGEGESKQQEPFAQERRAGTGLLLIQHVDIHQVDGLLYASFQPALGQAHPHWGWEDSRRRVSARRWTRCHC